MKENKGISMITLIVTIIVMIILLGLAYRSGSRYILESKEKEKESLVSILSSAVVRRQNDNYVGIDSGDKLYYGYYVGSDEFEKVSQYFDSNDYVYEPGLWFILDASSAEKLGIVDSDKYLVSDLHTPSSDDEKKKVAVVDYFSGKVFLVDFAEGIETAAEEVISGGDSGHQHRPTVVTCTEPSICIECGELIQPALGHDFDHVDLYPNGMTRATCTLDLKCERCGLIVEKKIGHIYDTERVLFNNDGHYNPCKNTDLNIQEECGAIGNFKAHTFVYTPIITEEKWRHSITCKGCDYGADPIIKEECSIAYKPGSEGKHIKYCTVCGREEEIPHTIDYRYIDEETHIPFCEDCGTELGIPESHVDDEEPYGECDLCDGILGSNTKPVLTFTMKNITPVNEDSENWHEYWAKKSDTIQIDIKTNIPLSVAPTIKIQGKAITSGIVRQGGTKWIATINLSGYNFDNGILETEISNIRSTWGVVGDTVNQTEDNFYINYDATLPGIAVVPE